MKKAKTIPKVFFNASVIIAGLHTPQGGSGKLLLWTKEKKLIGMISETIFDEVLKHANKIVLNKEVIRKKVLELFPYIYQAPHKENVEKYHNLVTDRGDSHVLASSEELKVNYLVSLDRKHILILSDKVKTLKIVSPKQLIEKMETV